MAARRDTRERLSIEFLKDLGIKTADLKIPAIRARLVEHYDAAGVRTPGRDAISRYMNPNRHDTKNVRPLTVLFVEACCKAFGLDPNYAQRLRLIEARARSPAAARKRSRLQAECDRLRAENEALKSERDLTRRQSSEVEQAVKDLSAEALDLLLTGMQATGDGIDSESPIWSYLAHYAEVPDHMKLPLVRAIARSEVPSDLHATALVNVAESGVAMSQELAGPLGELLFRLVTAPGGGDLLARLPTSLPDGWSRVLASCAAALMASSKVDTAACELIASGRHDVLAELGMEIVSQSGAHQLIEALCQLPYRMLPEIATRALEPVLIPILAAGELPGDSCARLHARIADVVVAGNEEDTRSRDFWSEAHTDLIQEGETVLVLIGHLQPSRHA